MRKLDLSEARKLVSARGALSRDQIAGLHQATQGWVTGIKLGAIALLKSGSATDDVGAAIHEAQWLDAYLTESVFSRLPPEMCALLASCAVPDRVNGALAAALSGLPRAADMLAWLWEQNTFLQREEGQDGWYRLHPVFREFLLLRLRARGGVPEAHEAAARFFLAAEQPLDAARHAIESGNAGLALEGVERAAMGMVERANLSTLLDWIARLPPASVARW